MSFPFRAGACPDNEENALARQENSFNRRVG
jgi:hypothetical protein